MKSNLNYVLIDFDVKRKLDLKLTEYCFLAVVDYLAYNAANTLRWCYASRKTIAEKIDVSERYIYTMSQRMQEKGLLEVQEETGYMRTTNLWFEAAKKEGEQSADSMNKVQKNADRAQEIIDVEQEEIPQAETSASSFEAKATEKRARVFQRPESTQIVFYMQERGWPPDLANREGNTFFDYYESNGWKIGGKAPMKDWQAAVRNWMGRRKGEAGKSSVEGNYEQPNNKTKEQTARIMAIRWGAQ